VTGILAVDARHVQRGTHEVVFQAPTTRGVAMRGEVVRAPVRLGAAVRGDSIVVSATSLVDDAINLQVRVAMLGAERTTHLGGTSATPRDTVLVLPPWVAEVEVDVAMAGDAWSRFTDFGVSLRDQQGRLLAAVPLNYATGRLRLRLPRGLQGDTLRLRLSPAAAVSEPATPWEVTLTTRFLTDAPTAIDQGGSAIVAIFPGTTRRVARAVPRWPVAVPDGWARLVQVVAFDDDDREWTREFAIPTTQGSRQ
jgi:hypothetical protein